MPRQSPLKLRCDRGKTVWKAIDDAGRVWTAPTITQLYRRVLLRNELLKNIAATPRLDPNRN